jgi:isopentenyl-diphosphate Delta-isomerase
VDENNNPLGFTKPKSEVHRDGDWHRAVHVWIVNKNNEVLVQKRSATKTLSPNLWDLSMGGHISAGEQPISAAIRELKEELNFDAQPNGFGFPF